MRKIGPFVGGLVFCAMAVIASAGPALAYTGPGAGITALGSFMALLSAIVLGIVGFIWYPVKRVIKLLRRGKSQSERPTAAPSP